MFLAFTRKENLRIMTKVSCTLYGRDLEDEDLQKFLIPFEDFLSFKSEYLLPAEFVRNEKVLSW